MAASAKHDVLSTAHLALVPSPAKALSAAKPLPMTHADPKIRVLAIDDDEIAREAVIGALEAGGFEVYGSASALGASRMITRQNIDAVVLDVMMPELNGDKLARLMRQNPRGAELTIVLVSSRSIVELQELARAAGADAVVPKQAIHTDLVDAVRTAYQKRLRKNGKAI